MLTTADFSRVVDQSEIKIMKKKKLHTDLNYVTDIFAVPGTQRLRK